MGGFLLRNPALIVMCKCVYFNHCLAFRLKSLIRLDETKSGRATNQTSDLGGTAKAFHGECYIEYS